MGRFEKNKSSNKKHYFNLKASNGQIIGTSQMYQAVQSRDGGIFSVCDNGPDAEIMDETV